MVKPLPRHQVCVDGSLLPAPISGHPALDLCNTWAGWCADGEQGDDGVEYLVDAAALSALAHDRTGFAGDHAPTGPSARTLLADAIALRAATYAAIVGTPSADQLETIAALSAESRTTSDAVVVDRRLTWQPRSSRRAALHPFVEAVTDLLESDLVDRVRRCPGEGCGWLFVDRSGRRRWCDMAVCGNRAKARSFADRHA